MIHQSAKSQAVLKENDLDLMTNFVQKIERCWTELKSMKSEIEGMYRKKDYFGIYKSTADYQVKLQEIADTKEEVKHYLKLITVEKENILNGTNTLYGID